MALDKIKTGLRIRPIPVFNLTQDLSEEELFKSLIKYLGAGYVYRSRNAVYLNIKSLTVLNDVLFPILDQHPVKYGKLKAYLIFKKIVEEMLNKNHLNLEGLLRIIYLSFELNKDTSSRTEESKNNLLKFLESNHGKLPTPEELKIESSIHSISEVVANNRSTPLSLEFIAGLIDGDGSFNISFQTKPYRRVKVNFTVVQESSCRDLLYELIDYFSCGKVYDLPEKKSKIFFPAAFPVLASIRRCEYKLEDVNLILNNVAPLLKVQFNTKKGQDYKTMMEVCSILKFYGKKRLTDEIFIKIIELAYDKNKLGKTRTVSKEELIQKVKDRAKVYASHSRVSDNKDSSQNKLVPQTSTKISVNVIQKRSLTSSCSLYNLKLNPKFVSGFVDGEGCFYIKISRDIKRTSG